MEKMLSEYRAHVEERAAQNIVPKPLDEGQTAALVELLKAPQQDVADVWFATRMKTVVAAF